MWIDVQGKRAYAYTGGRPFEAGAPCVAFVHGAQHDHSVWVLQSRYLAHHGHAVLAFDLPGHGRSDGPALPSIEAMAQWLLDALGSAGVARAAIVGHSMGSLVALEAAARDPERIERLVLVGTAAPMKVSDSLLEAAASDEARAFDMINQWSHSGITHHPGSPAPGFSVFVQNLRLMERQAPGVLLNDFRACNAYGAALERGAALRCPVLVVQGQRDLMTPPRAARELARRIADVRTLEIGGCGHNLMNEHPDEVRDAIRDFVAPMRAQAARA